MACVLCCVCVHTDLVVGLFKLVVCVEKHGKGCVHAGVHVAPLRLSLALARIQLSTCTYNHIPI